jgi:hypothetical protein
MFVEPSLRMERILDSSMYGQCFEETHLVAELDGDAVKGALGLLA